MERTINSTLKFDEISFSERINFFFLLDSFVVKFTYLKYGEVNNKKFEPQYITYNVNKNYQLSYTYEIIGLKFI